MDAKIAPTEETKDPGGAAAKKAPDGKDAKDAGAGDLGLAVKKPKKDKNDYLRNAITEDYADDSILYKPKVSREERIKYWQDIVDQGNATRKPKKGIIGYQDAWMKGDYDYEGDTYPGLFVLQLGIIKSQIWDYIYLFLLLLYLIIVIAVYDGLGGAVSGVAPVDLAESGNSTAVPDSGVGGGGSSIMDDEQVENAAALGLTPVTMLLPLIFMIPVQIIPALGMFYFINRCNDLVKFKATRTQFGSWAFASIYVAQACEYFFYGGRDNVAAAGKCGYGQTMMKLMGKKELDLSSLAPKELEEESDGDEEFEEDDLPAGHKPIADRIDDHRAYAAENPDDEEAQKLVVGEEEISFLKKIQMEKQAAIDEAKAKAKADEEERERTCEDWKEWTCMVCKKENRRPTHPVPVTDIFSGVKGVLVEREFALLKQRRDAPRCVYCMTYADYTPPLGSAHLFPYNKRPYRAFSNYPITPQVQAGLDPRLPSRMYNKIYSCCFGVRNNSASKLVYNDWRLRLYLNGRFPETPRQIKPKDELFLIGEYVECKLQRSDWARCRITKARSNHTYDIRYDPGDELRLVHEGHLRMPPEKRKYAYQVELMMVLIVMTFPLAVIAGMAITKELMFFNTFIIGGYLCLERLSALVGYFRRFYFAGFWPIFKVTMFFTLPLILMTVASAVPLLGMPWVLCSYFWIGAKVTSLPILYIMKPSYFVLGSIFFVFTSVGFYAVANFCDGSPLADMMAINLGPLVVAVLLLIYYRRVLVSFVDVNLIIRPPLNFIKPEPMLTRLYNCLTCVRDIDAEEEEKLRAEAEADAVV